MKPEAVVTPLQMGVPFGRRSPHVRGPYSMPKHSTFRPFLISTPAQIAWLMRAKVMSVVINVQKGLDLHHRAPQPAGFDRQAVEASLLSNFSSKDLEAARHSIAEAKPDIRNVLAEARISGGFAAKAATTAVEGLRGNLCNITR